MTEKGTSATFLILCLILLTIGFRVVHLQADPPADLSWSGGEFADEGFWSHNARNEVLFGNPVLDQWDARIVSPLFARMQTLFFRLFGVGLIQVRLIGLLSSSLIAVCCFLILRREFPDAVAFFVAVLISLNFPMLVLGRQGLLEPFAAALLCISIAFLLSRNASAIFLSGAFFAATCFTKFLMVYTLLPIMFIFLLWKDSRRSVLLFVSGAALTGAVWLFANYLPNRDLLEVYNRYYASQQNWQPAVIARNVITQPFYLYFSKTPALLFFGNLMLWQLFARPKTNGMIQSLFWIWLLTGIVFFAFWGYRPLRYYSSLLIPLAALAGIAITRSESLNLPKFHLLLFFGLLVPCVQFGFVLADRWMGWGFVPTELGIKTTDILVFFILTIAFIFLRKKSNHLVALFLIAFLLSDMRSYLQWVLRPSFAALEISHDLAARVGSGTVTGQWGPELALENRMRVVPVWRGFVNDSEAFEKYNISHILVWKYALGGEKFEQWYPEYFLHFRPVTTYRIKDSDLVLYERKK